MAASGTRTDAPAISGFMAIRNGLRLGYPFVEAIAAALPAVDELVVLDGYSEDGTFEVLERLRRRDPRIRLDRYRWDVRSVNGSAVRNAINAARDRASGAYILQVDANEVIPVEDVPRLRELARRYPAKELFGLPYQQFLGCLRFNEEFRYRFARNLPTIRSLYDGWTLGYRLRGGDLLRPAELRRLANRAAVRVAQDRIARDLPEQLVYLPKPVFRYYGLFPEPFFEKMRSKRWLQDNPEYDRYATSNPAFAPIWESYLRDRDYDRFWERVYDLSAETRALGIPLNKEFPVREYVPPEQHPAPIRGMLGRERYEVREELVGR
jgi:glycosyltransferase involved in cell wall biosynthesis